MSESTGHGGQRPDEDFDTNLFGEGHPGGLPVFEAKVGAHLRNRRKVNSPSQLLDLQELVKFKASHGRWRIAKDLVGMVRRGHGGEKMSRTLTNCAERPGGERTESRHTDWPASPVVRWCSTR